MVPMAALAGRELCVAGPDSDRAGPASLRTNSQSAFPSDPIRASIPNTGDRAKHATAKRWLSGGGSADGIRDDEPDQFRIRQPARGNKRNSISREFGSRRWKLADRHQSRNLGVDACHQRPLLK